MIDLSRFSRRERLALYWGSAAVALILGWFLVAEPLINRYAAMNGRITELAERTARYKAAVAGAGEAAARGETMQAGLAQVEAATFYAETDALAAAQMAELVRAKAQAAGITLSTSKPEKAEESRGFRVINLSITFNAPLSALARFMQELEGDHKRLLIKEAKIASQRQDYPDDVAESLSVRLLVAGLRFLPPEPTGGSAQ